MKYLPAFMGAIALSISYLLGYTPLFISVIYIVLSCIAFLTYAKDKSAAQNGGWRIPESTLHLSALFGGWPGAIIAQQYLRHKTKKQSFRVVFWVTVITNCGVLIWLHTNQGAIYLNTYIFNLEEILINNMSSSDIRTVLLYLLSFHS